MRTIRCFIVTRWLGASDTHETKIKSNIVHRVSIVVRADFVAELNVLVKAILDECDCVVDANRLREFSVGLQVSCFVGSVL